MKKSRLIEIINEEIEDILHAHSKKHPWSGHEHGRNAILQSVDTCMPTYEEKNECSELDANDGDEITLKNNSECLKKLLEMLREQYGMGRGQGMGNGQGAGRGMGLGMGRRKFCPYRDSTVPLNTPLRGDVCKYKIYVEDKNGNVKKINFGE